MGREGGWAFKEWNIGVPWSPGPLAQETISESGIFKNSSFNDHFFFLQGTHICTYKGRYIFSISNNISFVMAKDKPFRTFPFLVNRYLFNTYPVSHTVLGLWTS